MAIKISGFDIKEFFNDEGFWGTDDLKWIDDLVVIDASGKSVSDDFCASSLNDSDIVSIESGMILDPDEDAICIIKAIRKWLKSRSVASFVITVDKSDELAIRKLIKESGIKVKIV